VECDGDTAAALDVEVGTVHLDDARQVPNGPSGCGVLLAVRGQVRPDNDPLHGAGAIGVALLHEPLERQVQLVAADLGVGPGRRGHERLWQRLGDGATVNPQLIQPRQHAVPQTPQTLRLIHPRLLLRLVGSA
jgi:hypothetical protein